MRVILYLRVSTDEQSVEPQRLALTELCKLRGWEIVDTVEEVMSGARVDRPKRAELLKRAAGFRRGFDAIVVYKLDRWGRTTGDVITSIEQLTQGGIGFVSLTESLDLATPAGRALLGMLAVFAQLERDMIQERIQAGVNRYRERHPGKWGRPATARQVSGYVLDLKEKGIKVSEIAKRAGISRASVYRILNAGKKNAA